MKNENELSLTLFSEGEAEAAQDAAETGSDEEFASLIKGRFKDAYTRRTQNMINRRFRETKELEAYRDSADRAIGAAAEYFGTEPDAESLIAALERAEREKADDAAERSDDGRPEDGRTGAGRFIESWRRADASIGVAGNYESFVREAEAVKEIYPSFDLERECEDKKFTAMLACGVDVRSAYEALHHAEIISGAMQYAADRVYEASAKGDASRPVENGTHAGAALSPKKDVAALSASEIKDILRRVQRGEIVKF